MTRVHRRNLLQFVLAAATAAVAPAAVAAESASSANKRKARYRASSAEVQEFYRVNRYPAR
jgi:hypothetical protein